MGGCLVTEGAVLMQWCEKNGFGPFILTGLSMGGHVNFFCYFIVCSQIYFRWHL